MLSFSQQVEYNYTTQHTFRWHKIKFLMMKGFEKRFSNDIKTWSFGDDMSPLSVVNYNKIVNVIYTIVSDKLHRINEAGINKRIFLNVNKENFRITLSSRKSLFTLLLFSSRDLYPDSWLVEFAFLHVNNKTFRMMSLSHVASLLL